MEITLNSNETNEVIIAALCNGLSYLRHYGLHIQIPQEDYDSAKNTFVTQNPNTCVCYEDVLLEHLKAGKELSFWDEEGEEMVSFNLEQACTNLKKQVAARHILDILNERDDALTADAILQICLYGDIIFG